MNTRTNTWGRLLRRLICLASLLAASMPVYASEVAEGQDLTQLSIEQLMDVEVQVTSASRKGQKLSETAAAVYVVTREDIVRSGAQAIPEALRLAPGMNVARIDANKWAVSCRGFNDLFANKMLVLVDGRSVYTPTFSGVWWDALGVEIEPHELAGDDTDAAGPARRGPRPDPGPGAGQRQRRVPSPGTGRRIRG